MCARQAAGLNAGATIDARPRAFSRESDGGVRVEAWAWLSVAEPRWRHSAEAPPPMTGQEKAARTARNEEATRLERATRPGAALQGGGHLAEEWRAGMVDGVRFLDRVETIKALKREGRLREALAECYLAIEGAEADSRRHGRGMPAPWHTSHAAIIHRRLGERDEEIAVLERCLAEWSPTCRAANAQAVRTAMEARLAKARALRPPRPTP